MRKVLCIAIPFIWCGMIGGISFLEAPLKFVAPGVTLPIGLSIGSLVFKVFNRVELVLMAIWLTTLFFEKWPVSKYLVSTFTHTSEGAFLSNFCLLPGPHQYLIRHQLPRLPRRRANK